MEYTLTELKFLNMKKEQIYVSNPYKKNGLTVFQIENTLSEEDKLSIIDEMKEGIGSYLLNIIKKWETEKDNLPQNAYGGPKTVSEKAWIKRNDPKGIIDKEYNLGKYWLFKTKYKDLSTICPETDYGYSMEYTGKSVVHQWFHSLCEELYLAEKKHFEENDPTQIKLDKIKEYADRFNVYFDNEEIQDIVWNRKKDVSEEQLDIYINAYEELEKKINEISLTLNN